MDRNTPERMNPEAALVVLRAAADRLHHEDMKATSIGVRLAADALAALAQRVESLEIRLAQEYLLKDAAEARADALEKEAGRWLPIDRLANVNAVVLFHIPGKATPVMGRADDWHTGFAHWLEGTTHFRPLPAPPAAHAPQKREPD